MGLSVWTQGSGPKWKGIGQVRMSETGGDKPGNVGEDCVEARE